MSTRPLNPSAIQTLDPSLKLKLLDLCQEGWEVWDRFSRSRDVDDFHPFIAADYEPVLEAIIPHRGAGLKFLEWGSATGVITIIADLLGFEAYGIELDGDLVRIARELATQFDSAATFTKGSFIPQGYRWKPLDGDGRMGTIGHGSSGYMELGRHLDEFDVVFAFPWGGEEPMMLDLISAYGKEDALLLLNTVNQGVLAYRRGRLIQVL